MLIFKIFNENILYASELIRKIFTIQIFRFQYDLNFAYEFFRLN